MRNAVKKTIYSVICLAAAAVIFCGCQTAENMAKGNAANAGRSESAVSTENNAANNAGQGNESNVSENAEDSINAAEQLAEFTGSHTAVGKAADYTVYELPVQNGGNTVYGQLFLPDNEAAANNTNTDNASRPDFARLPLVIVSHGFQGSFRLCTAYTDALASAGYAVYAFDFCGGSTFSLSSGSFYDMSVLTELSDLSAVYDEVCRLGFIDREKIFLMGESQGGMVSALFAAKRPADVAGMVLFYPAFVIPDNAKLLYGSRENIPEWPYAFTMTVGRHYYLDTIDLDVYNTIKNYEGDVLLVHGDQDTVVPYVYSQKALEVYKNAELITIHGSNHGFVGQNLIDACAAAVNFINEHVDKD